MHYAAVLKKDAQRTKTLLLRNNLLAKGYLVQHSARYVYFPIDIAKAKNKKLTAGLKIADMEFSNPQKRSHPSYKDALKGLLGDGYEGFMLGYDAMGNIAVIELDGHAESKRKQIAQAIMDGSKRISTVLAKAGPVSGPYRVRKFRYIAGKRSFIAKYSENGCSFLFDVRRVFFSPRLSFERSRLAKLVSGHENVIVPFAGVGPFAIEIAKAHQGCKVVAIELNPAAYGYLLKNIKLNGTGNVVPVLGDFAEQAKNYMGFADRVVMPMPMASSDFINAAAEVAKKKAVIHMYAFCKLKESGTFAAGVLKRFEAAGRKARLIGMRTVRPYSRDDIEVVLDIGIG